MLQKEVCFISDAIRSTLIRHFVYFVGALAFLIVWFAFLWLWSIPIILIENGIGRFTKKSTVESFNKLLGPSYRFMGGFQAFAALSIGWDIWLLLLTLQLYQTLSMIFVNNIATVQFLDSHVTLTSSMHMHIHYTGIISDLSHTCRSYYSVIVGWCAYYLVVSCVHPMPTDIHTSNSTWNELQVQANTLYHHSFHTFFFLGDQSLACSVPWSGHSSRWSFC